MSLLQLTGILWWKRDLLSLAVSHSGTFRVAGSASSSKSTGTDEKFKASVAAHLKHATQKGYNSSYKMCPEFLETIWCKEKKCAWEYSSVFFKHKMRWVAFSIPNSCRTLKHILKVNICFDRHVRGQLFSDFALLLLRGSEIVKITYHIHTTGTNQKCICHTHKHAYTHTHTHADSALLSADQCLSSHLQSPISWQGNGIEKIQTMKCGQ